MQLIAGYRRIPADGLATTLPDLNASVAAARDHSNVITSALSVFPAGRDLVLSAELFASRVSTMLQAHDEVMGCISIWESALVKAIAASSWCEVSNMVALSVRLQVHGAGQAKHGRHAGV